MKLFLDDHKERRDIFLSHFPDGKTAITATEMISLISQYKDEIDTVFLDHDLDDLGYIPSKIEGTGMEVVEWIVANRPSIPLIIVHSRNGYASPIMVKRLGENGYNAIPIPFFDIDFNAFKA